MLVLTVSGKSLNLSELILLVKNENNHYLSAFGEDSQRHLEKA